MVFGMAKLAGRHSPKLARDLDVDAGRLLEVAALHQAHGGIDDGFRREPVGRPRLEPEDVARQMERADLAPPVGKQPVAAHRAGDDLVDIFRGLILAVDFLILPLAELARHQTRMPCDGCKLVGNGGNDGRRLGAGDSGVERRGDHLLCGVRPIATG